MTLPYADHARVDREKVTEYLLSSSHPDGRSKSEFFGRYGFRAKEWQVLARALCKHGQLYPVSTIVDSDYGSRYSIEGALETPDGRQPMVRTIWMIGKGTTIPRLITAYPAPAKG
jgi:hypothetical protein